MLLRNEINANFWDRQRTRFLAKFKAKKYLPIDAILFSDVF